MKFTAIVGNPPYQRAIHNNNRQQSIYPYFYDSAENSAEIYCLISPARFLFNIGATPMKWNAKMLSDCRIKLVYYSPSSTDVFNNVIILGGIAILYRNAYREYTPIDTFIVHDEQRSILDKVTAVGYVSISEVLHGAYSYRFTDRLGVDYPTLTQNAHLADNRVGSNVFSQLPEIFTDHKVKDDSIGIYGRYGGARVCRWIDARYIREIDNLNTWKVVVPCANGSIVMDTSKPARMIGKPFIAPPMTGYTQTFISFGAFKTKYEVISCLYYLMSRFCRIMLSIKKVTQNTKTKETWSKVPLQDFTPQSDIDWTVSIDEIDQQLYAKYGLNEEDIQFIESHIADITHYYEEGMLNENDRRDQTTVEES